MIERSLYDCFYFGTAVRYLQDVRKGERITDDADGGRRIRTNLRVVFATMAELNLTASLNSDAAARLRGLLAQLLVAGDADVLSDEQFAVLDNNIDTLRATLESELCGVSAYSRAHPAASAGASPGEPAALFAARVYGVLPAATRLDMTEALHCMALERPTAAAFHLTRAVATVLRAFYASSSSWRRTADHSELFSRLDHIRTAFPNPCQHLDATFGPEQARELWKLSVDVINRMAPALLSSSDETAPTLADAPIA